MSATSLAKNSIQSKLSLRQAEFKDHLSEETTLSVSESQKCDSCSNSPVLRDRLS